MAAEKSLNILLVDDEEIVHQTIAPYLRKLGHKVKSAYDGMDGLKLIKSQDYGLALVDVRMPGMDGMSVLAGAQAIKPEMPLVIITGHGNMELAVDALRLGATDFLTKPVKLVELDALIEKIVRFNEMQTTQKRLRKTIQGIQTSGNSQNRKRIMVAESHAMQEVKEQIEIAVEANCDTIMITGETGTGKEVVARAIHFHGDKNDQLPFIAVSCPAIPETLIESELFGHVKGSFTGATEDKSGCFEIADGGTLFLDEVADLSPAAQAKLLRVLETRSFNKIGSHKEISVDIRIIAATNTSLEKLVKKGKFRRDLLYRLNVYSIELKPLRERKEDIVPLAENFLDSFKTKSGLPIKGFSKETRTKLLEYSYPGNARELRNIVERSAVLCRSGLIKPEYLTLPYQDEAANVIDRNAPKSERDLVRDALERTKWNRRLAAKELGIPYSTLRYKMKKFNLS